MTKGISRDSGRRPASRPQIKRPQPTRAERAFTYELAYRALGKDRSVQKVWEIARAAGDTVALKTLHLYSADFGWVENARKYDEERRAVVAQTQLSDAIADNVRHASFGRAFQELALLGIAAKRTDEEGRPRTRVELSGSEIARLGEVGIKIERLASGMATDRMEIMSGAMRVIVEEIGPAVMAMLDALSARLDSVTPEMSAAEVVLLMRSAMEGERSTFAIRADNIIEAEFRAYGLVPEQATVPDEDEE